MSGVPRNYREQGMALPITLAVMAILSTLVFAIGHRGTLEAKSLHHWVERLEKEQRILSSHALVESYLSSVVPEKGEPDALEFEVQDVTMKASFYRITGAFNVNDLKSFPKKEKDTRYRDLIKKNNLSLHRENLTSWILDHSGPHLDLKTLSDALREELGPLTPGWPFYHPPFSSVPNGSVIAFIEEVESEETPVEILILEPRPKILQIVASFQQL